MYSIIDMKQLVQMDIKVLSQQGFLDKYQYLKQKGTLPLIFVLKKG